MAGALTASVCYLLQRLSVHGSARHGHHFWCHGSDPGVRRDGGFEQEFKRKILDVNAHITVNPYGIFDSAEAEV